MDNNITNIANVAGTFNSLPAALTSEAVITPMTSDLTITKTADKTMWADGELTYTVVVANTNDTLPYESVTFTDIIDPAKATLVADSVTLNGATATYTYDAGSGTLTVDMGDIEAEQSGTITFQVEKV